MVVFKIIAYDLLVVRHCRVNCMMHGYCWLENVWGHFTENAQLESVAPISLQHKCGPLFQSEGTVFRF